MDKETLSHYGWIVIVIIIISILIGLATPFARAIKDNFIGITNKLTDVAEGAWDVIDNPEKPLPGEVLGLPKPVLDAGASWFDNEHGIAKTSVTMVTFADSYAPSGTAGTDYYAWDASEANDGTVMAYAMDDGSGENTYEIIIAGNEYGCVFANSDSSFVFDGFSVLEAVVDADVLNTSDATTFEKMFNKCLKLESVDVGTWETGQVTTMKGMFQNATSIGNLNVRNWDTKLVSDMTGMFNMSGKNTNKKLTTLDVSKWDVSSCTGFKAMFQNCVALTTLNVSNWKTGNVADMSYMFCINGEDNIGSLKTLDVSNWDVSNVKDMSAMFQKQIKLTTIDVSDWNTKSCINMGHMFHTCTGLTTLDVSKWNTSAVTNMLGMFQHCLSLSSIDVGDWDVSNVTTFKSMFSMSNHGAEQSKLSELNVSKWDTSSCTDMSFMFYGLNGGITLDVTGWDVRKVTTFDHMFAFSYITLAGNNVANWEVTSVCTNMNAMLYSLKNTSLDVSKFDTRNVTVFAQMFEVCRELTEIIGLENFDTSSGLGFSDMFGHCTSLTSLNLSSFDTTHAKDGAPASSNGSTTATMHDMFYNMPNLKEITLGEKFSFVGDGTTTDTENYAVLPIPDPNNIPGATYSWYDAATGTAYTVEELITAHSGTKTYSAIPVN